MSQSGYSFSIVRPACVAFALAARYGRAGC